MKKILLASVALEISVDTIDNKWYYIESSKWALPREPKEAQRRKSMVV